MSYAPSAATVKRIEALVTPYPEKSAALLPVLHVIHEESGWVSREAEAWVAAKLGLPPLRVREVLSFYEMFRREPAARVVIRVCQNLSCTLAGAEDVTAFLREKLRLGPGDVTPDGRIALVTVECLGNCDHAPCLQINGVDHGRVTKELAASLVRELESQ